MDVQVITNIIHRHIKGMKHKKKKKLKSLSITLNSRQLVLLYFDFRPGPKMLFQGDLPEGSDTFQCPVIERDRVGGLRLIIWDKVKVPRCHYSDAPEESDL